MRVKTCEQMSVNLPKIMSTKLPLLVLLLGVTWPVPPVLTQNIPAIPCPDYFQYLRNGDQVYGKVTLRNAPFGTLKVQVKFCQRQSFDTNNGRFTFEHDLLTVQKNLELNNPITYRVDFPSSNEVPKLVGIFINDNEVCSGSCYDAPRTSFSLQQTFFPAPGSHRRADKVNTVNQVNNAGPVNTVKIVKVIHTVQETRKQDFGGNPFLNQHRQQQQNTPQPRPPPPPAPAAPPPPPPPAPSVPTTSQDIDSICGRESNGVIPLIHQGKVVMRGQFPWLTVIYVKQPGALNFICGGSLISSRTIITAAHCFKLHNWSKDQIVVYLGRNNLDLFGETGTEVRDVETLLVHPQFNTSLFSDADLALLQLSNPVSFTQYIRPICMWSGASETNLIVGNTGYVAGWGSDETGRNVSSRPKVVDARIVSEGDCLRSSEIFSVITSRRTLCAGNRDGTGPCSGDSGSGFMMTRSGRWTLRGVVSTGQLSTGRQCDLRQYVVYCDVAKHSSWVRDNMWN